MRGVTTSFPDYSCYTTAELIDAFAAGPTRYRQASAGLSEPELRARPRGPGRWSTQEIILHTADSELQGTFRIRKTWAQPEPEVLWPVHDQDQWSRNHCYQDQPPAARERALMLLALLREHTLPLFQQAREEDWNKGGTHPEFGFMTLRNLLELYADHTERHVEQMLENRALLGRPLDLVPLLPRRLY